MLLWRTMFLRFVTAAMLAVFLSVSAVGQGTNVTITPDNKWVVFRSNMHGANHTYAAELAKSK